MPGPEVAVEGLLSNGVLDVVALFDKPDPLDGPFFAETIYVTEAEGTFVGVDLSTPERKPVPLFPDATAAPA